MPNYSVIDNNIYVDSDNWLVSIMRKVHADNPEHAFLMIEGRNSFDKAILRRYDLFINKDSSEKKALIYIKPEVIVDTKDAQIALLEDILKGDEVYAVSWSIKKLQAESLHNDIIQDKANPPRYQISGDKSLIAKSTGNTGHSCFTWAREKLYNLNDERIKLPESYTDFVIAQTSRYIKGNAEPTSKNCLTM